MAWETSHGGDLIMRGQVDSCPAIRKPKRGDKWTKGGALGLGVAVEER